MPFTAELHTLDCFCRRTAVAPAQNTHDGHVNGSQPLKVGSIGKGSERCASTTAGRVHPTAAFLDATSGSTTTTSNCSVGGSSWLASHQKRGRPRRGLRWQLAVVRALLAKRIRLLYRGAVLIYPIRAALINSCAVLLLLSQLVTR